jgi:hypothetical protein
LKPPLHKKRPRAQTDVSGCCLTLRFFAVFQAEFLDPPGGVHDFLFAGIERVAVRAHFNVQRLAHGGTGLESVAATARHSEFLITWVNFCFHGLYP